MPLLNKYDSLGFGSEPGEVTPSEEFREKPQGVTFDNPDKDLRKLKPRIPQLPEKLTNKFLQSEEYKRYLSDLERDRGLAPGLLNAIRQNETGGLRDPYRAESPAAAKGPFQFMGPTAQRFNLKDRSDPIDSARAAADYLKILYDEFGDWRLAAAAYNAGEGNVRKYNGIPPFKETRNYVKKLDDSGVVFAEMSPVEANLEGKRGRVLMSKEAIQNLSFDDPRASAGKQSFDKIQHEAKHREKVHKNFLDNQFGIEGWENESPLSFGERFKYGLKNNFADIQSSWFSEHPEGDVTEVELPTGATKIFVKEDKSDPKWRPIDERGFAWGDIADVGGAAPGPLASAAFTMGGGPTGLVRGAINLGARAGSGMFLGELARGGLNQFLGGTQPFSGPEGYAWDALGEGTKEALLGFAFGAGSFGVNLVTRKGVINNLPEVNQILSEVTQARNAGMQIEDLILPQQVPTNPILGQWGQQVLAGTQAGQEKAVNQKLSVVKEMGRRASMSEGADVDPLLKVTGGQPFTWTGSRESLDMALQSQAKRSLDSRTKEELSRVVSGRPIITPQQAGTALKAATQRWRDNAKKEVSQAYDGVDVEAITEQPIFNFGLAKDQIEKQKRSIMAVPADSTAPQIPVIDPAHPLKRVYDKLDALGDTQVNWEVAKELRSDVGELLDRWDYTGPFARDRRLAAELYGTLSDVYKNPINEAPGYSAAVHEATGLAASYYQNLGLDNVQKILNDQNAMALHAFFSDPMNLTPEVVTLLKRFPDSNTRAFKDGIIHNILAANSADSAVLNMEKYRRQNPEAWENFVAPTKTEEKLIGDTAIMMDKLNNSAIKEAANHISFSMQGAGKMVSRTKSHEETRQIVNTFGGEGSAGHQLLKASAYRRFFDEALVQDRKTGLMVFDPKKMQKIAREYQGNGVWDVVFNDTDRQMVGALNHANRMFQIGTDVGASMETASTAAKLKRTFNPATWFTHPGEGFRAFSEMKSNDWMGWLMSNPTIQKAVLNTADRPQRTGSTLELVNLTAKALLDSVEPGRQENTDARVSGSLTIYQDIAERLGEKSGMVSEKMRP